MTEQEAEALKEIRETVRRLDHLSSKLHEPLMPGQPSLAEQLYHMAAAWRDFSEPRHEGQKSTLHMVEDLIEAHAVQTARWAWIKKGMANITLLAAAVAGAYALRETIAEVLRK